jgi:hypothetical protein
MCGLFGACNSTPDHVGQSVQGGGGTGPVVINLDASQPGTAGNGGSGTGVTPTEDANCGNITKDTSRLPADILLVLDRSGSMDYSTAADSNCNGRTTGCTARWPALTSAVNSTLTATAGSINWGLKLFSTSGNACEVSGGVEVDVSATSVAAIEAKIGSTTPGGDTPTAQAIDAAVAYLKTVQDTNSKYILLATDGEPNCGSGSSRGSTTSNVPGTENSITAAKNAGFPVYVIGIGPSVGNLDNFALKGGTNKSFPATSAQALTDAFASISKSVATCTFTSTSPPSDPSNVAVYLNKNLVNQDPANGWSFGANNQTIVLNGTSCDTIMSSSGTASVQILFGCAGISPPVIIQ